jgi:hypothetical protein
MPQRAATPPLAQGRDGTVYLVLDDFGALGSAFRETDAARADLTTVVADLLSGQYRHPLRVVAFKHRRGLGARRQRNHRAQGCHSCALPAPVRDFVERACP